MPTIDSITKSNNLGQASNTWSHTIGTGDDRILIVTQKAFNNISPNNSIPTSITYDGSPLIKAPNSAFFTDGSTFDLTVEIWYLVDPPVGTANVVVTYPGTVADSECGAASFFGVDQTPVIEGSAKDEGVLSPSTSPQLTLTSVTDEALFVDTITFSNAGSFINPQGSQQLIYDTGLVSRSSYLVGGGAGNQIMGWTTQNSTQSVHTAVVFKASGGEYLSPGIGRRRLLV